MNALVAVDPAVNSLSPRYVRDVQARQLFGPRTLAVFGFGSQAPSTLDDPRYLHVGLEPRDGAAWFEVWESDHPVRASTDGMIRSASNGQISFGWLEYEEGEGGIAEAAERGYRALLEHLQGSKHPELLRIWNYLDAITDGAGDDERYRQFCLGRAAGFQIAPERFPAATAIGRKDGRRVLQIYWLSAAEGGVPLENPRQMAAWRYPREYGPRPPTFARALLAPPTLAMPMMLSGTAAVVGHASQHAGDLEAQLDETMRNFAVLIDVARSRRPSLPAIFGRGSLLKIYVAGDAAAARIGALLSARLQADVPRLVLHADVCRTDLVLEIDGFHA